MKNSVALIVAVGLAASANAGVSSIIYTDAFSAGIYRLDAPNSSSLLIDFGDIADVRLADIDRAPDGSFWVGSGPIPEQDPSTAKVIRIAALLGATPVATDPYSGDPLHNPTGIAYHAASNHMIMVNRNTNNQLPNPHRDIRAFDVTDGSVAKLVASEQDLGDPKPHYRSGNRLVQDPFSDDMFVTSINGSIFSQGGGDHLNGSVIHRLAIDTNTLDGTLTTWFDLGDTAETGLADPITFARGIEIVGSTMYIADGDSNTIYSIAINGDGTHGAITPWLTGVDNPNEIRYDPFQNKLIFSQADPIFGIFQVDLDGSNLEQIASDVDARGIYVVPAPGALATLALAGLVAARRRR